MLASLLRAVGQSSEAKAILDNLYGSVNSPTGLSSVYSLLLADPGDNQDLVRADRVSADALDSAPNDSSLLLCRGAVLAAAGRNEEAEVAFKKAWPLLLDPRWRGYVAVMLGLEALKKGDRSRAHYFLRQADYLEGPEDLRNAFRDTLFHPQSAS